MNRKLPVGEIFSKAVSLTWEKREFALRVSWPYFAAMAVVLFTAASTGPLPDDVAPLSQEEQAATGIEALAAIAQWIFLSIVAVYWHRNILLQERDAPSIPLRFDGVVWRYIGYALLLGLIVVAAGVVGTVIAIFTMAGAGSGEFGTIALVVVLAFLALIVMFRCSVVLPAAAVGDRALGLRGAWHMTRGHTWQLVLLQLLLVAAAIGCGMVLALLGALLGGAGLLIEVAANFVVNWAIGLVGLAMLSLIYAWLKHEAPPPDAEMT